MPDVLKPRIMGIDYGQVRVGVAVSDPLGYTAQPVDTFDARDAERLVRQIGQVCDQRAVQTIVVGLPLNMDGSEGPSAQEARRFAELLEERLGRKVELWDERLSTMRAERTMLDADLSRARRRKHRDRMAAQFILQGYLEAHR